MAMQKSQSSLFAKLGDKLLKAHEEHKNDEVTMDGFGELPADINGGVAQLVDCKFDVYKTGKNSGKPYFYASGVVKSPRTGPKGELIVGLRTRIGPEALCDTPEAKGKRKTLSEHLAFVYQELQKLGVDTKSIDPRNLEIVAAALKQAKPHFRFRTWQGQPSPEFPNPRVSQTWGGACEFSEDDDAPADVDDSSPAVEEDDGPGEMDSPPKTGTTDIKSLVKDATAGDEDAGGRLTELALEAGVDEDSVTNAANWGEVGEMIKNAQSVGTEEEAPVKGGVHSYTVVNLKTKKETAVDCEVMAVDKKLKTVTLKNLSNPKLQYKDVKWSQLK